MTAPTLLVPYANHDACARVLRLACRFTGEAPGRIVVLALTRVHRALPLEGIPAYFDAEGWYALGKAQAIAQEYGLEVDLRLRRTYDKGKTIIRESQTLPAHAILLAEEQPRYWWLPASFDGTRRFVMRHAPCPVFTASYPAVPEQASWDVLAEVERVLERIS